MLVFSSFAAVAARTNRRSSHSAHQLLMGPLSTKAPSSSTTIISKSKSEKIRCVIMMAFCFSGIGKGYSGFLFLSCINGAQAVVEYYNFRVFYQWSAMEFVAFARRSMSLPAPLSWLHIGWQSPWFLYQRLRWLQLAHLIFILLSRPNWILLETVSLNKNTSCGT